MGRENDAEGWRAATQHLTRLIRVAGQAFREGTLISEACYGSPLTTSTSNVSTKVARAAGLFFAAGRLFRAGFLRRAAFLLGRAFFLFCLLLRTFLGGIGGCYHRKVLQTIASRSRRRISVSCSGGRKTAICYPVAEPPRGRAVPDSYALRRFSRRASTYALAFAKLPNTRRPFSTLHERQQATRL